MADLIPIDADPETAADVLERVPIWVHTFALNRSQGIYTHGVARDHRYRLPALPEDFSGLKVLDIGTFDGFYTFLAEARGAARVVAVDNEREILVQVVVDLMLDCRHRGWGAETGELDRVGQRIVGCTVKLRDPIDDAKFPRFSSREVPPDSSRSSAVDVPTTRGRTHEKSYSAINPQRANAVVSLALASRSGCRTSLPSQTQVRCCRAPEFRR